MVLQNYQNLKEMTSNIFHIVAFGVGFKCPRKIRLNTQCPAASVFVTILTKFKKRGYTLLLEKRPRSPERFRMRPPVMVPMMDVFFSITGWLIDCGMELIDPFT